MKNIRVYIAGPYTKGDVAQNVAEACKAADRLMNHGFSPYVPHLTHFQHMLFPRSYNEWIEHDLVWLRQCNVLLRLPGESPGADLEVQTAKELGIPVIYDIRDLR